MGRLSTHVLDTSRGLPAAGVEVQLHALRDDGRYLVATMTTNQDGRTDGPLAEGNAMPTGIYELTFRVASYLRGHGVPLSEPPFLGDVIVRIGIADSSGTYHVPLLFSPFGYSTYRGS
ncbi:MAG TPA: hydroxyisourate hydrolase [Vicinamibacterales bacterium]|nr:hydroxyisourate hydrolase [Vicinamibacterales bacterium]